MHAPTLKLDAWRERPLPRNSSQMMSTSRPQADDSAQYGGLAKAMNSENTSPIGGHVDPAAIALVSTYVIDLTETTYSDVCEPEE
jgi:hypothetical protein